MNQILEESLRFSSHAIVRWKPSPKSLSEAPATRSLLGRHLYLAEPFRKPKSYPRQRNYYGLYYFAQTQSHVWHESLNEANMMMYLDHVESVASIAAQPMEINFADGSKHVPDLLVLHGNHRQVLYDVKPMKGVTSKALEQFAKTQAVCAAIGWGYQVLTELPAQTQTNLTWLRQFEHPHFHPGKTATSRLLRDLTTPTSLDAAAGNLIPGDLTRARSALLHLLWHRIIRTDLTTTIDGTSLIERNSK